MKISEKILESVNASKLTLKELLGLVADNAYDYNLELSHKSESKNGGKELYFGLTTKTGKADGCFIKVDAEAHTWEYSSNLTKPGPKTNTCVERLMSDINIKKK